ncbi:unnamed protein product, partial [Iphiclides podalirius]
MLQQVPDKETQNNTKTQSKQARRRRKRKFAATQKSGRKEIKTKNPKFFSAMSTWAENFTVAATWQLKHQIAYWKAKAKALEYENEILHEIIRKNNFVDNVSIDKRKTPDETETHVNNLGQWTETYEDSQEGDIYEDSQYYENCEDDQEDELEVSEEFIQFLTANAKYKEDARRERERLRARVQAEESLQREPQETTEEKQAKLKELYGSHWQRISALEIALQSQFIHDVDKDKAIYWPNVPLNF